MEITNEYLVKLAEKEAKAIQHIASPLEAFSRMFSKAKQQQALEDCVRHEARIQLISEIQKDLNA